MSKQDEAAEKSHEPTPKKLADARKKGEVVRSNDVATATVYGSLLLIGAAFGTASINRIGGVLTTLIDRAPELAGQVFDGHGQPVSGGIATQLLPDLATWLLLPGAAVILAVLAQRAFVFAPSKLKPKLNRISLIQNAKNKFGRNGLFEFAKSFTKLVVYSLVLGVFLNDQLDAMVTIVNSAPRIAASLLLHLCLEFMIVVLVVAMVIAVIDYGWQFQEHHRKNRMSRQEVMDEIKQSEGDPHMKQQRRQRAHDIAMNQMLADVPTADVVVVNPTHYAVALKWSRESGSAPVCVAKGIDEVARSIRQTAQEAGVPIHSDPPTARAVYAAVQIGEEIREEHYVAVAAAIRFSEAMRQKARRQPWAT